MLAAKLDIERGGMTIVGKYGNLGAFGWASWFTGCSVPVRLQRGVQTLDPETTP